MLGEEVQYTPVKTRATATYTTVVAINEPIIPIGKSFCGFLHSSW